MTNPTPLRKTLRIIMAGITFVVFLAGTISASGGGANPAAALVTGLGIAIVPGMLLGLLYVDKAI